MSESLNTAILQRLKTDEELVFKISKALRKKFRTVERWIREEDQMLTSDAVKNIIREHTGLTDSEILEETKITA